MKNCKISTICFENTLFPLPSFFILKKKKKGPSQRDVKESLDVDPFAKLVQ